MLTMLPPIGLDIDRCRARQQRLRAALVTEGLDAALLTDRRHVYYFSGYWHASRNTATALLVTVDGATLVAPGAVAGTAAEHSLPYEASRLSTLVDDQLGNLLAPLQPLLAGRVGCDAMPRPWLFPRVTFADLNPVLFTLRRTKDADEVALIRRAVKACEGAYARARDILHPGVTELALYAELQAAAVETAGEPLGDFGNDFQSGTPGGMPRQRSVEAGEIAIFDLTAIYRGYCCDLCRSFAVDGTPSPAQLQAFTLVADALEYVERTVKPGVSCAQLYQYVFTMLDGQHGWRFSHHLGHGIGLAPHEGPRLNPHWGDTFRAGDTFTAEPGLYGDNLRGGIRIEQNYLVTATGVERLSLSPITL